MSIKDRVGEALAFGRQEELRLMRAVPIRARTARGSSQQWTAKDSMIHQAVWKLVFVQAMENPAVAPDDAGPDEPDQVNQVIFASAKDLTWGETEALLTHAHQRTLGALQRLEGVALENPALFPWLGGQPLWRRLLGSAILHPVVHYALAYRQIGMGAESLRLQERVLEAMDAVSPSPEWLGVGRYNLACAYALQGETDQALARLTEALRLRPDLTAWSKQDPDFEALRSDPRYQALYAQ